MITSLITRTELTYRQVQGLFMRMNRDNLAYCEIFADTGDVYATRIDFYSENGEVAGTLLLEHLDVLPTETIVITGEKNDS